MTLPEMLKEYDESLDRLEASLERLLIKDLLKRRDERKRQVLEDIEVVRCLVLRG
jgi:hypothetical protein